MHAPATYWQSIILISLILTRILWMAFLTWYFIANMEKADLQLDKLKDVFTALGNEIGVEIRVQSEEIFTAMHRI